MSKPLDLYIGRITPWQSTKPNFVATVSGTLQPVVTAAAVVETLPGSFDLDSAIGVQLDATGQWIGPTRNVSLPITPVYFSLDVFNQGLDQAVWKEAYSGEYGIFQLDDETYRRLLQARVLSNHWDGTVPGAQAVFDAFFIDPATLVFVQDNAQVPYPVGFFSLDQDGVGLDQGVWFDGSAAMANVGKVDVSMTIGIAGKIPPSIYLGLLVQNALAIKPAGVTTNYAITSVDGAAVFGLDMDNEYVAGLDVGAIGVGPETLLEA